MIHLNNQSQMQNQLLANMQPELFEVLAPYLEYAALERKQVIENPDETVSDVYFPGRGVLSVIARTAGGTRVETGLIGPEGMTGVSLVYGVDHTPNETLVQIPCRVLRIATSDFRQALINSRPLHLHLLRYAYAFSIQVAQGSLCNSHFTIEQRLARWLLMCHDRIDREDLMLTHEFLSLMLGVRRAGVTTALRNLAALGSIGIHRGTVVIRDRGQLISTAGETYGAAEVTYAAVMGTTPPELSRSIASIQGPP